MATNILHATITEGEIKMIPIPPYVPSWSPVPTVTPFTYRDGVTMLKKVDGIIRYLNRTIVPYINETNQELADKVEADINNMINVVNTAIQDLETSTDTKLENMQTTVDNAIAYVNTSIANLTTYVDEQVALIIQDGIQVQDPVVAAMLQNPNSQTRTAADQIYIPTARRSINLADRIPAGHNPNDPADAIVNQAIADGYVVEWPENLTLTFTDPNGITIPLGKTLRGGSGAKAKINHAGPGFKVSGVLSDLAIEYTGGASLADVAVFIVPGTARAVVSNVNAKGGNACFAVGGNETTGTGDNIDALIENCTAFTDVNSSFCYRIDESVGVELAHCIGLGSKLDSIKLRKKVRYFRVIGGRYTGAIGGDGLDGFAGADQAFIGGGVVFHDNGQNGMVVKTDDMPPLTIAEQDAQFGTPKRIIIDGVIANKNGGYGVTIHRSDDTDSEVIAGTRIPWLRKVLVSNVMSTENNSGMFVNVQGAHLSGIIVAKNRFFGISVHANARDVTMTGVHAHGNSTNQAGGYDNFVIAGQRIFLAQCMSYGVDVDAVDEADLAAASKTARYGYRIPAGALVRMVQCSAAYNVTAPVSDSDGNTTMIDCTIRDATGTVSANTAGHIMRNDEAITFKDGVNFRRAIRYSATGGATLTIGDNSGTGLDSLILSVKSTGAVISTSHFNPQANTVYDIGAVGALWRDISAGRYLKIGGLWLRNNAGAFEKSTDSGTTWALV